MITTFYSYKGGVGRSMALASTAEALYRAGFRVMAIDFDLEAPGLEFYFGTKPEQQNLLQSWRQSQGLLDLLCEYRRRVDSPPLEIVRQVVDSREAQIDELRESLDAPIAKGARSRSRSSRSTSQQKRKAAAETIVDPLPAPSPARATIGEAEALIAQLLANVNARSFIEDYLVDVHPGSGNGGCLKLMPAGRRLQGDSQRGQSYGQKLASFSWPELYQNYAGKLFFEWFRREALRIADFVLIDSRTGVTEIGGVGTCQLPDAIVMLMAPNRQNLQGCDLVARGVLAKENFEFWPDGLPPAICWVRSRVEPQAIPEDMSAFRGQCDKASTDFVAWAKSEGHMDAWWKLPDEFSIPYHRAYAILEKNPCADAEGNPNLWLDDPVAKAHLQLAAEIVYMALDRDENPPPSHVRGGEASIETLTDHDPSRKCPGAAARQPASQNLLWPRGEVLIRSVREDESWARLLQCALESIDHLEPRLRRLVIEESNDSPQCTVRDSLRVELSCGTEMGGLIGNAGRESRISWLRRWLGARRPSKYRRMIVLLSANYFAHGTEHLDFARMATRRDFQSFLLHEAVIPVIVGSPEGIPDAVYRSHAKWVEWERPSEVRQVAEDIVRSIAELKIDYLAERTAADLVVDKSIALHTNLSPADLDRELEKLRHQLDWDNTTGSARKWWQAFEDENKDRKPLVLKLMQELNGRKPPCTITEFFLAYVYSNTDNIQANLHYLDYTRLKKEEERKKREATQRAREQAENSDQTRNEPPQQQQ